MTRKRPEQRIAEAKANLWSMAALWVAVVVVLSLVPLIALSLHLAREWWP